MTQPPAMEPTRFTLVTGASSGIGREIAVRLSRNRSLILQGRNVERLNETRALCLNGDQHVIWPVELREPSTLEAQLRELLSKQNYAVEAFVHSAGAVKVAPMRNMDLASAQELMNVNFFSASELVRLLLKKAVNGRHLRNIVFISSTASRFGAKGFNLYCASKGALDSLMRALAVELAPDIRVNSVLPGGIRTAMTDSMFSDPALAARLEADYPLGLGKPGDVASAVEFLVSENARWVTGQQLVVDGGRTVNISG